MVVQLGSSDLYDRKRWRWVVVEGTEILDPKTSGKRDLHYQRRGKIIKKKKKERKPYLF
jgi:hypothetical protein